LRPRLRRKSEGRRLGWSFAETQHIRIPKCWVSFLNPAYGPDHLNAPRVILNSANTPVWRWDATDAFGTVLPNGDPDGDGLLFEYNLRFPGQFYDKETGLHYNYYRDYDSVTGRYIDSDPTGLAGGINAYAYAYVNGNPVNLTDPNGLMAIPAARAAAAAIPAAVCAVAPSVCQKAAQAVSNAVQACRNAMHSEASDDAQPNEKDLTKVKEREGNKVAQEAGYQDAKDGRGEGGVDIYRDKTTGDYWLWNGVRGGEKERL